MSLSVMVFGPTGNVGSIVAQTARNHGAKVFLAMRNIGKSVPGLSPEQESKGGYERVQVDLTKPLSVYSAAKQTKATSAFMYLAHGSTDHMRATIEASKAAGIKFIVLLSSFTIKGELDKMPATSRIPYIHARVEMNLEEVYGHRNYVALRTGAFATNTLRWRTGIGSGEVNLESPDTEYDYITPEDMGRVGGRILVGGQTEGQHVVYLYGPQLVAQKDALSIVVRALGKEPHMMAGGAEQHSETSTQSGSDSQRVKVKLGAEEPKSDWFLTAYSNFKEGADNVVKYTEKPGKSFEDWVNENKIRYTTV